MNANTSLKQLMLSGSRFSDVSFNFYNRKSQNGAQSYDSTLKKQVHYQQAYSSGHKNGWLPISGHPFVKRRERQGQRETHTNLNRQSSQARVRKRRKGKETESEKERSGNMNSLFLLSSSCCPLFFPFLSPGLCSRLFRLFLFFLPSPFVSG